MKKVLERQGDVHEKVANQSNSELPEFESNSECRTISYSN
jgi:hypothetical protein